MIYNARLFTSFSFQRNGCSFLAVLRTLYKPISFLKFSQMKSHFLSKPSYLAFSTSLEAFYFRAIFINERVHCVFLTVLRNAYKGNVQSFHSLKGGLLSCGFAPPQNHTLNGSICALRSP